MAIFLTIPLAAVLAYRTEKKLEETIAISAFLSVLILVAAGLAGSFRVGCVVIAVVNALALLGCVWNLVRDRRRFVRCIFTKGLAAFLVLSALMFVASYGRYLQAADEYTYWARLSKYYYLHDSFGNFAGAGLRYLEISAIWDYFSTQIWSHFSIGIMTFGHAMLIISYLLPVFSEFSAKRGHRSWGKWALVVLMIWMFPMLGAGVFHGYVTLYADMLLGAGMIYTLIMFLRWNESRERFHFCCMLMGMMSTVLTKQSGMIIGFVLVLAIAGTSLATHPSVDRRVWLSKMLIVALDYGIAVALANGIAGVTGRTGALAGVIQTLLPFWPLGLAGVAVVIVWLILFCRRGNRFYLTIPVVVGYFVGLTAYILKSTILTRHQMGLVLFAILKTVMCNGASHMGWLWEFSDYTVVNLLLIVGLFAELVLFHKADKRKVLPGICRIAALGITCSVLLNILYSDETYSMWTFVFTAVIVAAEVAVVGKYFHQRIMLSTLERADAMQTVQDFESENKDEGGTGFHRSITSWLYYYLTIGLVMYLIFCAAGIILWYGEPVDGWSTQNARSLWRYMFSYMGPMIFLMGYQLMRKPDSDYSIRYNPFWTLMVLVLLDCNLPLGVSQLYEKPAQMEFKGIEGITFTEKDVITFVNSNSDNEENAKGDFSYQVYPGDCTSDAFSINWYEDDVLYGERMTPEEVSEMLTENGCTYVYLRTIDMEKGFAEYYAVLFENSEEISYDRLYRVEKGENGLISLVYVPRQHR